MASVQDRMTGQQQQAQQPLTIQGAMLSPQERQRVLLQNLSQNIGNIGRKQQTINPLSSLQDARAKQVSLQNSLTNQEYQRSLIEQQRQQQVQAEEQAKRQTALQQHMAGMRPEEKVDFMLQNGLLDDAKDYVGVLKTRKEVFSPETVDQLEGLSTGYIDYLKSNKMPPSPEAYNDYISRKGSGVTVNVGADSGPELPPKYMWKDPENPRAGVIPLPGTKEAAELEAGAQDRETSGYLKEQEFLSKFENITDAVDEALDEVNLATTGFLGAMTSKVAGTPAYDLSETLDTIKANIGFDTLQKMREASPTGGALGQVSERELAQLERSVRSLNAGQSPSQVRKNLRKIQFHYDNWKDVIMEARAKAEGLEPGEKTSDSVQPLSAGGQFEGFKVLSVE